MPEQTYFPNGTCETCRWGDRIKKTKDNEMLVKHFPVDCRFFPPLYEQVASPANMTGPDGQPLVAMIRQWNPKKLTDSCGCHAARPAVDGPAGDLFG